ncbi:Dip2/Utp12 protein [Cyanidiococcus yangmingshanensis]|uniref:Dip2/Utp12 protein n=1 Tax=Cyanidiococcus yangmingshanensis TaxID=2690220 RepID=A0A7J7IF99_9RHOD|nr:Dip2/Utp12 protein [Cyanidiococcus yangmingshanensis]
MQKIDDKAESNGCALQPDQFNELMRILRSIRPAHYEAAIASLPLAPALLLTRVCLSIPKTEKGHMECSASDRELLIRTVLRLFSNRFRELVAHMGGSDGNRTRRLLSSFREATQHSVRNYRSVVGMNLAALQLMQPEAKRFIEEE